MSKNALSTARKKGLEFSAMYGRYRIRPTKPQQLELQVYRPHTIGHKGHDGWVGISWFTTIEQGARVLLRRTMGNQSMPCHDLAQLVAAVEQAEAYIGTMLLAEIKENDR